MYIMLRFKHSGAYGDLIYGLPLVRHLGGGEFYLHLHQIDWIGQHYYGSRPDPFHQGRLTRDDFFGLEALIKAQPYIQKFEILAQQEITHNLDRFRPLFVGHPGNYVDIYAHAFGITDPQIQAGLRNTPWLTVPTVRKVEGRPIVINRSLRWLPPTLPDYWHQGLEKELDKESIFLGLPEEYSAFTKATGWRNTEYVPTKDLLDMAEYIQGSELYIGNQSVGLALALGLGKTVQAELRRDLPRERNECYFHNRPNTTYF